MQLNQNNNDKYQDIINKNEKVIPIQAIENRNYLYPDGHRMTHQMRWFKAVVTGVLNLILLHEKQ